MNEQELMLRRRLGVLIDDRDAALARADVLDERLEAAVVSLDVALVERDTTRVERDAALDKVEVLTDRLESLRGELDATLEVLWEERDKNRRSERSIGWFRRSRDFWRRRAKDAEWGLRQKRW